MTAFNVFRVAGDVSHTLSKIILMWAIHSNSSAEGVSLITQALYAAVFCTRYLDIFTSPALTNGPHIWNFTLKLFYPLSSFYIIFLMTSVYARTREREKAWKLGLYCLSAAIVITPFWYLIFKKWINRDHTLIGVLWTFSEILESVCVIPQLVLLRQTTVPTVIDSYYLVTLGAYRAFYVMNWMVRSAQEDTYKDPTSWVWGTIQTALMIDFAWVYYTRQRVKLRQGGVVDSEDFGRGWLVGRFAGRKSVDFDYDEEAAPRNEEPSAPNKWGRRGISVSADEDVEGAPKRKGPSPGNANPESQPLADPAAFEDESDDDAPPPAAGAAADSGVRRDEWDDDVDEDAQPHNGSSK